MTRTNKPDVKEVGGKTKAKEREGKGAGRPSSAACSSSTVVINSPTLAPGLKAISKKQTVCQDCDYVIGKKAKAMNCDRCKGNSAWKCIECLDMSEDEYDILASAAGNHFHWFCDECKPIALDNSTRSSDDKIMIA